MSLTATTQTQSGFMAFASVGMRWAKPPRPAPETRLEPPPQPLSRPPIDVEARLVHVQAAPLDDRSSLADKPLRLESSNDPPALNPMVAAYAPPARSGQAPRLLYASPSRGQLFESWA